MTAIRTTFFAALLLAATAIAAMTMPALAAESNYGVPAAVGQAGVDTVLELAASPKEMQCLKTCMEKYGDDKKKTCALECGLGGGAGRGDKKPDCGIQYKACNKACGRDKACKDECRAKRRGCV